MVAKGSPMLGTYPKTVASKFKDFNNVFVSKVLGFFEKRIKVTNKGKAI